MAVCAVPDYDYAAQPTVAVPTCPVCGTANRSCPATDRVGYPIGVSQCKVCELAYLNPRLTDDAYTVFYRDYYRRIVGMDAERLLTQQRAHGESIGGFLKIRYARTGGRLLDVGGSTGEVAKAIAAEIPMTDICVVDPNSSELGRAQGVTTRLGTIETADLSGPWDAIVCTQTIDHCTDPILGLQKMRAALAPKGWLFLDILDAPQWARHVKRATYDWKIDHPLYWTDVSIRRALRQTGWRIIGILRYPESRTHLGFVCEGKD